MTNCEFSDGTKRLLRGNPALPAARTRELATAFTAAQAKVCAPLAELGYPLERAAQELKAGHLEYFREGSDQDRKRNSGKKSSYRFAGFAPSRIEEFDRWQAERRAGVRTAADFTAWQAGFLMSFTFEIIEQVALRALPVPTFAEMSSGPKAGEDKPAGGRSARQVREELAAALAEARRLRDEILTGNLLLVAKLALQRGRFHPTMVLDDLFMAGTDGLMIAIGRYDAAVGQFSTYATPWVKMAIDRFVAKTRQVIRIPIGLQEKVRRQRNQPEGAAEGRSNPAWMIPEVQSMEDAVPGFGNGELRLEDVVADPQGLWPREVVEQADVARILHERVLRLDGLKQFVIAMRNDIGDAGALAARLFREESALSLARGRATCAAAAKAVDEPARICLISAAEALVPSEPEAFAFAV
jgi:hypothetical protein